VARSQPKARQPASSVHSHSPDGVPGPRAATIVLSDGNSVAFSWNGETEDNWDIYVKLIGPGSPQRLTTDPAIEFSPAWSPDGRSIAFGRIRAGRMVVVVIPSRGGPEREVFESPRRAGVGIGQILSWSPDSRILVVTASSSADTPAILTAVDVATGEARPITAAPPPGRNDSLPSVSPDGKMVAFVRSGGSQTGQLYVQALAAGFASVGESRRLEGAGRLYHGVAWTPDGRDLIVSAGNTGDVALWRIPLHAPERPERLSPPGDECRQPAVAMQQGRLAFTRATRDENIWRLALSAPGRPSGAPVSLTGSTLSELDAQFSPDATRIVFESLRSGTQEIWVSDRDGRNALQLTSFNGHRGGTPAWSPDGQSIAYDVRDDDGQGDIYVIPARGGAAVRLTNHPADDLVPSWSRDGRSIYFGSTRTGRFQIWKVSARGGEPVQMTQHGGTYAKESLDGRDVYYARTVFAVDEKTTASSYLPAIWRVPSTGGDEVPIVRDMASYGNFAVAREGIYFESSPPGSPVAHIPMFTPFTRPEATIDFLSFATGKVTRVITLDRYAGHGFDLSADGRTLLFGQMDSFTEDLMLVENFR
jgi:Tol biopolymer transport system component